MSELGQRVAHYRNKTRSYARFNKWAIFTTILFSLSSSVAGFSGQAYLAGILSLFSATVIALQRHFALGKKARFYAQVRTECEELQSDLKYKVSPDARIGLEQANSRLRQILRRAREQAPVTDWDGAPAEHPIKQNERGGAGTS